MPSLTKNQLVYIIVTTGSPSDLGIYSAKLDKPLKWDTLTLLELSELQLSELYLNMKYKSVFTFSKQQLQSQK